MHRLYTESGSNFENIYNVSVVHLESSFGVKSDLAFLHWYYSPDPNASNLGHFRLGICDERFPIYIISVPFSSELNPTRNNSRKVESRLALKNKSFVLTLWFPIFSFSSLISHTPISLASNPQ